MAFPGLDRVALSLLRGLPSWDSDEFAARRQQLHDGLVEPCRDLIAEVAARLDDRLTVDRRRSVSPLHRDLRFAPQGSPRYKDHLLLTTWQGSDKRTSPTLWIRLDSERVGFASGIGFTPTTRERWRTAVDGEHGADLADRLGDLERRGAEVAGDRLKNVPRPFGQDHPRHELLRLTDFQVRFAEGLPDSLASPSFVDWCVLRLGEVMPVHRWLVDHVTTQTEG